MNKFMMTTLLFLSLLASSCMKSKEEYRQSIDEIQKEEAATGHENPERRRGSDDREGMGDISE